MKKLVRVVLAILGVTVFLVLLLGAIGRGVGTPELTVMLVAYAFALRFAIRGALAHI